MIDQERRDLLWMQLAIDVALMAKDCGDIPFGCVIVSKTDRSLITTCGTGTDRDPTSHSEIRAIRAVCGGPVLHPGPDLMRGMTLYSTAEPCPMCCGAINHAKISRVVWGSYRSDLKAIFRPKMPAEILLGDTSHPPSILGGVLRDKCIQLFDGVVKWDLPSPVLPQSSTTS